MNVGFPSLKKFPILERISDQIIENMDKRISQLKPHLLPHFIKKWSSHVCIHPSCKREINIDGNNKLIRLTCIFNEIYENSIEIQSNFFKIIILILYNIKSTRFQKCELFEFTKKAELLLQRSYRSRRKFNFSNK